MDGRPALVLASASPRRTELLTMLGASFIVEPADVDESVEPDESAAGYVIRLARAKATKQAQADRVVIAADTAVVVDDEILGKPADDDEARAMLRRLSGRVHDVHTGIAVAHADQVVDAVVCTHVWFRDLDDDAIDWYVATGEPADKAGAYGIQGIGGLFVEAVQGSVHNVIGLPLAELDELLDELGFTLRDWVD